ncbi:hypothetical protein [Streptomyces griseorubiginosus]|uniref:hypothetical protein n=1 Tax=Streptomyces griseorubiginosus TaxID=67304 RepID=UPI001AD78962|nr:hypothetical protein [Streptomyces griseorubiginosus]MBO4253544.1 hypothetical protein [Streptomyces griseorubiginosus]
MAGRFLSVRALLVPGVPAALAVVLLTLGVALSFFDGRPYVGGGLITAGLIAGAAAVGAAVGDVAWCLLVGDRELPRQQEKSVESGSG